jgi:hypothetical protein
MSEIKETDYYDHANDRLITKYEQDVEPILDANRALRNATPETGKYRGNLVHAASLSEVDVLRLKNLGYDLLSPDPDERRRALVYIQQNEPHHLVINGKPFARKRPKWA